MLRTLLKELRQKRVLSDAQAAAKLSQWQVGSGKATRSFTFESFEEASNFILRFSEYATKVGSTPSWQNVYNGVTVTLENSEFGKVTDKEVQLAHYLDRLH